MLPCEVPPEAQTFLYNFRKLLLVFHFAGAVVLIGAATHLLLQMPAHLRGTPRIRLERVYGRVVAVSFSLTYVLGAVLYPTYRYHVRALYFDRYHPMLSNLFDIKENLATIALPLAIALGVLGGRLTHPEDAPFRPVYAVMSLFVAAVVWFNVVSGVVIASYRAV
jgi:hypothetical protein